MAADKPAQAVIAPFAALLTTFLWVETWAEILSKGTRHSPDDLSKLYLAVMGAYAGAAEISKWLNNYATDPTQDPRFERIQRGGLFIALWLAPLLFAYGWRISDPTVPMPGPLPKITIGLVGIFFLKAASRRFRHKKHGVIDPVTGRLKPDSDDDTPDQTDFSEALFQRVASNPDGMSVTDIQAAFPEISKPRLYRTFDDLMAAKRLKRTGRPRTPDVRYHA